VQLAGSEKPAFCLELKTLIAEKHKKRINIIKTFKVGQEIMPYGPYGMDDYTEADFFLFDTYVPGLAGGTGKKFNWEAVAAKRGSIKKPFFLAGGLNAGNVSEAIAAVRPYGVDVSSGIEKRPGEKDPELLKEFVSNAKRTKIA
jgi:phosphoribosylanthranilate isomerase